VFATGPTTPTWDLDTVLLSCRVLGRGVESALLRIVTDDLVAAGATRLTSQLIPDQEERAGARLPARHGFAPASGATGEARRGPTSRSRCPRAVRRRPRHRAARRRAGARRAGPSMMVPPRVRHKLDRLRDELARDDLDRTGRALRVAELSLAAARISPIISIGHERFYELTTAPSSSAASATSPSARRARRFPPPSRARRHTRRHRRPALRPRRPSLTSASSTAACSPTPGFTAAPLRSTRRAIFPRWTSRRTPTGATTHTPCPRRGPRRVRQGVPDRPARAAHHRGAARIRCRVKAANAPSVALHDRFGFTVLGTLIACAVPGARLMPGRTAAPPGSGSSAARRRRHDPAAEPRA